MTGPMRPGNPTQPGNWCDQHKRVECTKNRKGGGLCHAPAVLGVDACRMHGGQAGQVLKAKGEAMSAWRAVPGRVEVSPADAVMAMLQMSWARVHLYAGLLERQVADADPSGGTGQGEGLIGHTVSAAPQVGMYETGEAVRGLALLEAQERDRCVKYAKVAHDMGIADREIRLAEQQGVLLAGAMRRTVDAMQAAVLALLGEAAVAEVVRRAWPGWVAEIVPRELMAAAGGGV